MGRKDGLFYRKDGKWHRTETAKRLGLGKDKNSLASEADEDPTTKKDTSRNSESDQSNRYSSSTITSAAEAPETEFRDQVHRSRSVYGIDKTDDVENWRQSSAELTNSGSGVAVRIIPGQSASVLDSNVAFPPRPRPKPIQPGGQQTLLQPPMKLQPRNDNNGYPLPRDRSVTSDYASIDDHDRQSLSTEYSSAATSVPGNQDNDFVTVADNSLRTQPSGGTTVEHSLYSDDLNELTLETRDGGPGLEDYDDLQDVTYYQMEKIRKLCKEKRIECPILQPAFCNNLLVLGPCTTQDHLSNELQCMFPSISITYVLYTPIDCRLVGEVQPPFSVHAKKWNAKISRFEDHRQCRCDLIIKAKSKLQHDFGDKEFFVVTVQHLLDGLTMQDQCRFQLYHAASTDWIDLSNTGLSHNGKTDTGNGHPSFYTDILMMKCDRSQLKHFEWLENESALRQHTIPSQTPDQKNSTHIIGVLKITHPRQIMELMRKNTKLYINDDTGRLIPSDSSDLGPHGHQTFTFALAYPSLKHMEKWFPLSEFSLPGAKGMHPRIPYPEQLDKR